MQQTHIPYYSLHVLTLLSFFSSFRDSDSAPSEMHVKKPPQPLKVCFSVRGGAARPTLYLKHSLCLIFGSFCLQVPNAKNYLKNKNTPFVKKRYKKKQTRTNLAWLERTEF